MTVTDVGPSVTLVVVLILAGLAAGWVDAVVGGGGLIQLPALVLAFPGAAPSQLLATNKLASICGTSTSAVTYFRRVRPDVRTALPLALPAFGGAVLGAWTSQFISRSAFIPVVVVLLLGAGGAVLRQPRLGQETDLRFSGRRHVRSAAVIGLAIGFYDGLLGPGTGSFLVLALVGVLGYAFVEASAQAKIANAATNLGALVVFVPQGAVMWRLGLAMGAANLVGGYVGARTAVARGNEFVRVVYVVVIAAFVVRLGWGVVRGR